MKKSIQYLLLLLLLFVNSYGFQSDPLINRSLVEKRTADIIGTIKKSPEGFGCYAVRKKDWNILAEKRPYVFIRDDDGKGLMNIIGKDILLDEKSFIDINKNRKDKKIKWVYKNEDYQAVFDLIITKSASNAYHITYEGNLIVSTSSENQTIPIKATCYD